jgi:hypothetical protein
MEFEKEFDIQIPDDQADIATVGQAISYIEEAKNNKDTPVCNLVYGLNWRTKTHKDTDNFLFVTYTSINTHLH